MGDINAKVGLDNSNCEAAMGKHGSGSINDNGERLVDFCLDIHKLTWKSPDGRTINQIDHIIINKKWRRPLLDVKVYRGADVSSDHYMLLAKIKLKLMAPINDTGECKTSTDRNRKRSEETSALMKQIR